MKTRNFIFILAASIMLCFNSCKKETVDVTELLTTVPSSASGVVVFNMEGLLEDAGCKIKDREITPSPELQTLIDKVPGRKADLMMLFKGDTGIEPKGAVLFNDAKRWFLSVALYDVDKFCNYIEKNKGLKFSDAGSGVKIAGNYAVKGAQAWVCLSVGKSIDADAIASYASLKPSQSFMVLPMGEKLLTEEDDIRGWALTNLLLDQVINYRNKNMYKLALGFIFEDAESIKFSIDFKKGELESEAVVLNSKGKPAKCQLPTDKVNVSTLKTLGNTCDMMVAFNVTPKLVKKFQQISESFGGALLPDIGETLKNIDGTVGLATCGKNESLSVNGVITTNGDPSQMLKDMLSEYVGPVSMDGKLLRFSKGDVKGNLTVEYCAEELKGCCLGIIMDGSGSSSMGYQEQAPQGFQDMSVKLKPEDGGLELEIEGHTTNPKENALMAIIKSL